MKPRSARSSGVDQSAHACAVRLRRDLTGGKYDNAADTELDQRLERAFSIKPRRHRQRQASWPPPFYVPLMSKFTFGVLFIAGIMTGAPALGAPMQIGHGDMDFPTRVLEWLMTPISGAVEHYVEPWTSVHGRLMVFAWAILTPIGIIIARFYKVTPDQDWPRKLSNPFWMLSHRVLGQATGVIMAIAVALVILATPGEAPWRSFHASAGWFVVLLGLVSIIGSLFRGTHGGPREPYTGRALPPEAWRGDHYDMTPRRVFFERVHKSVGYLTLAFSIIAILSGLAAADALVWMWLVLAVWWLGFILVFTLLQRQGRCIDTYQAIWGINENLPGNRVKPVGWGIRRFNNENLTKAPWPRSVRSMS